MKIENLLDLDARKLSGHEEAVAILAREWYLENSPSDTRALISVLKRAMDTCQRRGIVYPRVFLLRKAQLMRGEFEPRNLSTATTGVKFTAPTHPKIPQEMIDAAVAAEQARLARGGKTS